MASGGAEAGMAAISIRGRDLGRVYFVTGVEGRRLYLVDGRGRGIARAKMKHIRHVRLLGLIMPADEAKSFLASELVEREKDTLIRKEIDRFLDKIKYQGKEGVDA